MVVNFSTPLSLKIEVKSNKHVFCSFLSAFTLLLLSTLTVATNSQAQSSFQPAIQLTDSTANGMVDSDQIAITPDGERVVYIATQTTALGNSSREIFSVAVQGGNISRLNPNLVIGGNVTIDQAVSRSDPIFLISANSEYVVYIADQNIDDVFELFSAPVAGGTVQRLNPDLAQDTNGNVVGDVSRPSTLSGADFQISSDSQHVVYRADQDLTGVFELYSVAISGGNSTKLNPNFGVNSDIIDFQISPDGQHVIYLADQNSSETFELFSVPIDGGSATRLNPSLVANGDVNAFEISPDSQRVVYLADQVQFGEQELFSVSITGQNLRKLNASLPASGDVSLFQISPDSQTVVYLADQITNNTQELFSTAISGSGNPSRLNATLTSGGDVSEQFAISSNSETVVYLADQNTDNVFELFSTPIAGTNTTTRLNPTNTPVAETRFLSGVPENAFAISSNSQQVVYLADFSGGRGQLLGVPIASGNSIRLDAMAPGEASVNFQISPDSSRVSFITNQGQSTLFSTLLSNGNGEQINNAVTSLGGVANALFSANGQTIAFVTDTNLFSATLGNSGNPPSADPSDFCVPISTQNGNTAVICL